MELEDLKEKYKASPLWARLAGVAVLALLPGVYTWYDESEALDAKLAAAHSSEDANRAQFERDRSKRGNRPKLEEQKAFITEQLTKAKKKLPDEVRTEEILNKAATIAKETGVRLKSFRPAKEQRGGDDFKYYEVPVGVEINGKFSQIAAFFDRVVHLDGTVFIRKIDINPNSPLLGDMAVKLTPYERARRERTDLTLTSTFEIVVFRSMSDAEQAALAAEAAGSGSGSGSGSAGKKKAPNPPGTSVAAPGAAPVAQPAAPQAMNETTVIGGTRKL